MELVKEALLSGNVIAWVIALVAFIVIIQVLKSIGKGILVMAGLILAVFLIAKFFPGLAEPISDFIGGIWMESQ